MIGEIMRRSVLGERRDIPQTGDGLIQVVWNYWGNGSEPCNSRCSIWTSEWTVEKPFDASKTRVIEKSRDGQDFLCTGRHHVIQGHGGPLPALH